MATAFDTCKRSLISVRSAVLVDVKLILTLLIDRLVLANCDLMKAFVLANCDLINAFVLAKAARSVAFV